MGGGSQNNDDEMITAINVTPLVDIVLVLLIILMVTANYIASHAIPMDLPKATPSADGTPPRTLTVSINREGAFFLDAQPTTEEGLRASVRAYVREVGEAEARAAIAADSAVPHGTVVHVIDLLRDEHVGHFAINVQPDEVR